MRASWVSAGILLLAGLAPASDGTCDRACLEGFVNQYPDALAAHDPARLLLATNARYTENGQTLKLDDGMWGPKVTLGTYKLYFADPKAGQVGFMGVVEENGHPQILALRLRVEGRKIAEMEAIVARSTPGLARPQDRDKLARIANSYFEGLEKATGKLTPFEPQWMKSAGWCTRSFSSITPYSFLLGELFKIKDGKITRVEAVLLPVPYGMPSGCGKKE